METADLPALHVFDAGGSIALLEDRLTESSSNASEDGNNVGEGEEHGGDDSGSVGSGEVESSVVC